jgi:hypothetical protein
MCAECAEHWMPTDPELWLAYYTDDEPPELASTARSAPRGSSGRPRRSARRPALVLVQSLRRVRQLRASPHPEPPVSSGLQRSR